MKITWVELKIGEIKKEHNMEDIIYLTLLLSVLAIGGFVLWHLVYTWYKDREWRRNNPEEHDILQRKIKDDFSGN